MSKNFKKLHSFNIPSYYAADDITKSGKVYRYMFLDNIFKENYSKKLFLDENPIILPPNYQKLTVIIPFRSSNDFKRMDNLKIVLKYLKFIGVKHVILSEEDAYSHLESLIEIFKEDFDDITLIFTYSSKSFNKSVAANEGVKKASTPFIAIMDSDVLISKETFDKTLSLINSFYDFVYPFNRMVKQIYDPFIDVENFNFDEVDSELETRINADGGFLFCRKDSFLNVGGYDETFEGWGGEDNDLCIRMNLSDYKVTRLNNVLYHLHHQKEKSNRSNVQFLFDNYYLSKFQDIDILINQKKNLYLNSILCSDEEDVTPSNVSEYLLSVIVPVYNCEFFYIDRCINSLKNQTLGFENIEVILVDDASSLPQSIDFINSYTEKYENVKAIFFDVNSGAGMARNAGIKAASAKYITFLDHDDYYVKNICEIAYKNISSYDVDIVITNFINLENIKGTNWNFLNIKGDKKIMNNCHEDMNIFLIAPSTGTKTYRKDFLINNNLFYRDFKVGQDLLFNHETLFKAEGIILIDVPAIVYAFRRNTNLKLASRSLDYSKEKVIDLIGVYTKSFELFKDNAPNFTHISLRVLNYWVNQKLLKSFLSFEEFIDVAIKVRPLATYYTYNNEVLKEKKCSQLLNSIVEGNFNESYKLYKEFI